jgi:hypothetical protein
MVLDLCDRASASDSNAKEAVKALKREFKFVSHHYSVIGSRLECVILLVQSDIRSHLLNFQLLGLVNHSDSHLLALS